jgi:adenine-specific DNA methylase
VRDDFIPNGVESSGGSVSLEDRFDATVAATLALREKQIQQNYRPIIGVHKWFARRPGTLFRNLMLAEFGDENLVTSYFRAHRFSGVLADPFMGGGTPLIEANRLGFHVVGADINPMAWWIVRQELGELDDGAFVAAAEQVASEVEREVGGLYETDCCGCGESAQAKYFIWVKTQECPSCGTRNDLFPGYLLAENTRHPKNVLACSNCSRLVELDHHPGGENRRGCPHGGGGVQKKGPAHRNKIACKCCAETFVYPAQGAGPPEHRMWAIEYHCEQCKPTHKGRFFKSPDEADLRRVEEARTTLQRRADDLYIPAEEIPLGDETKRLHRWGYHRYRDMFGPRQLLGLGLLLQRIRRVEDAPLRHALATVFSDFLRYQNMLCRYDTYGLKCQDIFAVHGFPVGLVQCENNVLGIAGVGSGSFRHFIEKYRRAKAYCSEPFEKRKKGKQQENVLIADESIKAELVLRFPEGDLRQAHLLCGSAPTITLPPESLDGVFTDPPYFDNVQYSELINFCYVWLRWLLADEFDEFNSETTQRADDLTGNKTLRRGLEHFAGGLSEVFQHYARALKSNAPFVFTYHHNKIGAYAPLVVAMLDAGLECTAVLPAPGEMEASLHINGTGSSILDSVFVCRVKRDENLALSPVGNLEEVLTDNLRRVALGGVRVSDGDARCLFSGHIARVSVARLHATWNPGVPLEDRLRVVTEKLEALAEQYDVAEVPERAATLVRSENLTHDAEEGNQLAIFGLEAESAASV